MDLQPTTTQPMSDDQELAKVLAGVSQEANSNASVLNFEETPVVTPAPAVVAEPVAPVVMPLPTAPVQEDNLADIKQDALTELRPLVDKLDLAPDEKFDTYLLLLRSTDDKTLIAPAHAAAQAIVDETRRAQALLDIIKEIDYLSTPQQ